MIRGNRPPHIGLEMTRLGGSASTFVDSSKLRPPSRPCRGWRSIGPQTDSTRAPQTQGSGVWDDDPEEGEGVPYAPGLAAAAPPPIRSMPTVRPLAQGASQRRGVASASHLEPIPEGDSYKELDDEEYGNVKRLFCQSHGRGIDGNNLNFFAAVSGNDQYNFGTTDEHLASLDNYKTKIIEIIRSVCQKFSEESLKGLCEGLGCNDRRKEMFAKMSNPKS